MRVRGLVPAPVVGVKLRVQQQGGQVGEAEGSGRQGGGDQAPARVLREPRMPDSPTTGALAAGSGGCGGGAVRLPGGDLRSHPRHGTTEGNQR